MLANRSLVDMRLNCLPMQRQQHLVMCNTAIINRQWRQFSVHRTVALQSSSSMSDITTTTNKEDEPPVREIEIQKAKVISTLQSIQEALGKYEEIVDIMSQDGLVENVPQTPVKDKEEIMKQVVNIQLPEIASCLEKIAFIEAAEYLTTPTEDEKALDESLEASPSDLSAQQREVLLKQLEFDEELLEKDDPVEDISYAPVNSTLYQMILRVLSCIAKLDRSEIASIMGTKVLTICDRIVTEIELIPDTLLSKPLFQNTLMIRFNTELYNLFITSFALHGQRESVTLVLNDMKARSIKANAHTYHALVLLAVTEGDYIKASKIIEYEAKCGFQPLPETMELLDEMRP
jgi:hypothetical protein